MALRVMMIRNRGLIQTALAFRAEPLTLTRIHLHWYQTVFFHQSLEIANQVSTSLFHLNLLLLEATIRSPLEFCDDIICECLLLCN
jgi:hypothetical protein